MSREYVTRPWPSRTDGALTRKTGKPQMDYCSSCRRHLNGALVCPGCGAYAPDIAPPAADDRDDWAPAATGASDVSDTHEGLPADEAELGTAAKAAPSGRAARRRQLARWKKNKRRAAVASTVALFGGGLTIATMDRHTTDRAQAAVAPDDRAMGAVEAETPERKPPASEPATTERTRRPSHTPAQPQQAATDAPRQQSLAARPGTTTPIARQEAVAPDRPAAVTTPRPQSTAPATGDTTPAPAPEHADTPPPEPSAPATSDATASDTPRTSPALISTSPTEICLLGVCLS
jgi:hypothetical protein